MRKKQIIPHLIGVLAALCWILFGITASIFHIAGDSCLLADRMLALAPPAQTGLPATEYPAMGSLVAEYLTGEREPFQLEYTGADGWTVVCFHDYEAAHMADCRFLIRLDRIVMDACLAAALALSGVALAIRRVRESFFRGMGFGLCTAGVLAAGMAAWAAVNFRGLFVTFHRVAFTNDGWLLNPRTDLLIRLMPEALFMDLGLRGLLFSLIAPLSIIVLVLLRGKRKNNA